MPQWFVSLVNSLRFNDTYTCQLIGSSLVQVTACCLSMSSHYLNQCWFIDSWIFRNKLQWNSNQNKKLFIQGNAFQNVICKSSELVPVSASKNVICKSSATCPSLNVLISPLILISYMGDEICLPSFPRGSYCFTGAPVRRLGLRDNSYECSVRCFIKASIYNLFRPLGFVYSVIKLALATGDCG